MLLVSGWLVDWVGVCNIFFIVIVLFIVGLLFCVQVSIFDQLVMVWVLQGVGGVMMVLVGCLMVMKIVLCDQYMVVMIFVILLGQVGLLFGLVLGGVLVEYVFWYWIFFINILVGIVGVIVIFCLMFNYIMQIWCFDFFGFLLLVVGMVILILVFDGQKGFGIFFVWLVGLVVVGFCVLLFYLWYVCGNVWVLFSFNLFCNCIFFFGFGGSFVGCIGSGMLLFMILVFLQIGFGFFFFYVGLMMILMVFGSMGMKWIVVQVVNCFGYCWVLVVSILGLVVVSLLFMFSVLVGWYYVLLLVLFLQGMINVSCFFLMNILMLKDFLDDLVSSGNSLLLMVMQLLMSIGVIIVGLLLGLYGQQYMSFDVVSIYQVFFYIYLSMVVIIVLLVFIFFWVLDDVGSNIVFC